ncbi:tRNA pseudouridine synthase B [Iodidimonas nitroreducens]|uniref:tRNA pseudouridine synthase B n=1 Tax=Iodidimonas nitroreducens TaxID=1236968 RepID=A0A5A7N2L9_9PROT|nr:tRNA pseudouridine(55) synthase TruB [Iodidimonas nitroreducens]GAK34766.1 tRNA pseudouridine synthase B [alpha proteobacterium Q-1]GER02523.1 tRNA pseudouridine synthase B [Iodidimonas nitroreducens]
MSQRRRGQDIHGWVILDKPLGLSSSQGVGKVRGLLDARKAGHAGTLDPLASGVLPIGLGEATKAMPFIVDSTKDYVFSIAFGEARSTDDCEGEVVARSDVIPNEAAILAALPQFIGEIAQVPPAYSAIKLDGKRAYALARGGETPLLQARPVHVHDLRYLGPDEAGHGRFFMCCGKGTYVRSLARDLSQSLDTVGHVAALRRTRVGPFHERAAISLENLEKVRHGAPAEAIVLPVTTALDDIPALAITDQEADLIKKGQCLRHSSAQDGDLILICGERPVAIARCQSGLITSRRVFNL